MLRTPPRATLLLAASLLLAACSQDAEVADPGGMGAEDLEAPEVETPAVEVLRRANTPANEDTAQAEAPTTTGQLRDTTQMR